MENELRTAKNEVKIIGEVIEHKLNEGTASNDNGTFNYINGSIVVRAGETTEVSVKVFVQELTKKKEINKTYATLKRFIDGDLLTEVSATEANKNLSENEPKFTATKVSIFGNGDFQPTLKEERYANAQRTEAVSRVGVDLGFGRIAIDDTLSPEDYLATFDVEAYVKSIEDEVVVENDEEKETGRVVVKGYVPLYGGDIMPITMIATKTIDEDGEEIDLGEGFKQEINEGDTVDIWGSINFDKIVVTTKKKGTLGKAKVTTSTKYVHELIIEGADVEEDEERMFDEDDIRKALQEREIKLEEIVSKAKENDKKSSKKGTGINTKKVGVTGRTRTTRNVGF